MYAIVENIDTAFLDRAMGGSDGYLYEYHWLSPYYLSDLGDGLDAYAPLFEPRTRETEPAASLYGPIRELIRAINQPNDALWRQGVEPYLDLPQLMSFAAVESFLAELDGLLGYAGVNNFYLYRPLSSTRHVLIPWDRERIPEP